MTRRARQVLLAAAAAALALLGADRVLVVATGRGLVGRVGELAGPGGGVGAARFMRMHPVFRYALERDLDLLHVGDGFTVTVRTNARGLRDEPLADALAGDPFTILALGDSFTFGWGVEREETFVQRLERRLVGPDGPVTVINAGVPGWSADHVWLWLQEEGHDLPADLVLFQLSVNDLGDLGMEQLVIGHDGLPTAIGGEMVLGPEDEPLLREVLRQRGLDPDEGLARFLAQDTDQPLREALKAAFARRQELGDELADLPMDALTPEQIAMAVRGSARFRGRYLDLLLERIEAHFAAQGVPVRWLLAGSPGMDAAAAADLSAWCAGRGAAALDLTAALDHDPASGHHFATDPHWTAAGHAEVAERVARWLADDPALGLTLARPR